MKFLLFILLSLLSLESYCQQTPRYRLQQLYIYRQFENAKISIRNTRQADSLYGAIQASWDKHVTDSLRDTVIYLPHEALNNLDAYAEFMTLIWATGKTDISRELQFHVFKNYMLPALTKDYQMLKADPSSGNLQLINIGAYSNMVILGSQFTQDTVTYNNFYTLYSNLRQLLRSVSPADTTAAAYVRSLLNTSKGFEYDLQAKYELLNRRPDLSVLSFITGLSVNTYYRPNAVKFGKNLLQYFHAQGENDKAFAVLNALMFYTSNDDLPRDSLQTWYTETDPEAGKNLYRLVQQKITGAAYKTSSRTDLKMPVTWNIIANVIPQAKITGAKFIILDFWYTACMPCLQEIPELNKLAAALKNRSDILFLSVNTDYLNGNRDQQFVRNFAREHHITFPVVYDNTAMKIDRQLNIIGYPTKLIFTNKGRLVSKADDTPLTMNSIRDFISRY